MRHRERTRPQDHRGDLRLVDVEAGVGDAGEPDRRRCGPGLGRDGVPSDPDDLGVGGGLGGVGPFAKFDVDLQLRVVPLQVGDQRQERRAHLFGVGLAGGDAPVDVDLAAIGHHVGGAAAADQRGVDRGAAGERMLQIGEHLGQAEQEPGHRRDRVDASMRLRAVGGLPVRGRGEPGAASLGQPQLEFAGLAHDARVLIEEAALPQHLRAVDAGQLLVGGEVEHQGAAAFDPRPHEGRRRRERRPDRPLHVGRATPHEPSVVDRSRPGIRRPGVGRSGRHDVEVAVPRQVRPASVPDRGDHAGASGVRANDRGIGTQPAEDRDGDLGSLVLGAAGILASGGDQRSGEGDDLVRIDGIGDGLGQVRRLIYHGARCYLLTISPVRCRRRSSRIPNPCRRPGTASPPCWRR